MQSTSPSTAHPAPSDDRRSAALDRRAQAAGEQLSRLAAADQASPESDRSRARRERLGVALRRQSEALAIERRRSRALREELRRLRDLAGPEDQTFTAR